MLVNRTIKVAPALLCAATTLVFIASIAADEPSVLAPGARVRLHLQPLDSYERDESRVEIIRDGVGLREATVVSRGDDGVIVRMSQSRVLLPRRYSRLVGTLAAQDATTFTLAVNGEEEVVVPRAGISLVERSVGRQAVPVNGRRRLGAAIGVVLGALVVSKEPLFGAVGGAALGAVGGSAIHTEADKWDPVPSGAAAHIDPPGQRGAALALRIRF